MEIQKDLHSLRSLYRILQTTANDMDEGPRLLFKNLLDSVRDNLLLSASKIITTERSMSSNSNVHMQNLLKSEKQQSIVKHFTPQAVSEENRKRRCRVCQQTNIEKQIKDEISSDFSKQVSNSIKVIESTILYLQLSDIVIPIRLQLSEVVAAEASKRNWAENSQKINESPAYHYVHGLRIASIQDDYGTRVARPSQSSLINDFLTQPDGNMNKLAAKPSQMTLRNDFLIQPGGNIGKLAEKPSQMTLRNDFLTQPDRNIGKLAKCRPDKACRHIKNRMKPTPLDQRDSDTQSVLSSASSHCWRSRSETETETENETKTSSHMTAESSAEESRSNSSQYSSESYKTTSSRRKMYRTNPDKTIGGLRRFKHKLGLIFHHYHHHHHHHHHHQGEIDNKNVQRSMWKQLGRILHHKEKQKTCEKQTVGKLKTSAVSKKQAGQFQELMKGMMRHVRHSKKSKFPGGGFRHRRDNKHWWKMLERRPQGAVKLPNRGSVRLQFKTKKPQLRALRK